MKIVVAIDSEASAKSALDFISAAKYPSETEIHLIHVIVPGFADVAVQGIPDVVGQERKEEQELLNRVAAEIKQQTNDSVSTEILYGETATVIADACKKFGADQVLVPSHHRHGFSRFWFGSVADEIVDAAPCTAVVLKLPAKEQSK